MESLLNLTEVLIDMGTSRILEPFNIFVVWDEKFAEGQAYAKEIFDEFNRKENDYSGESIGIPVKFITLSQFDIKRVFDKCEYVAVVLLIDHKMIINLDKWGRFIELICENCSDKIRLYPVILCSTSAVKQLPTIIKKRNYIDINSIGKQTDNNEGKFNERIEKLIFELTHEFSRLLHGCNRVADIEPASTPAAIKIFLSHAREDGKDYADEFNRYLMTETSLDRFIDCCNIYKGDDFEETINQNIESAALLILCTDSYSSREWCQYEVLNAKSKNRPILLVDMLKEGEKRRFPYMANVRTMHMEYDEINDGKIRLIILKLLFETLRNKYSQMYLEYIVNLYSIKTATIFPYPPELYTLLLRKNESKDFDMVLYSEPPLNKRELGVLTAYLPQIKFVTPTYVLFNNGNSNEFNFTGIKIGLSVSEISDNSIIKTNAQLKIMLIELCRYLIVSGTKIVYGGNISLTTKHNFVNILNDIIANYSLREDNNKIVQNFYLGDFSIPEEKMAELASAFEFIEIESKQTTGEVVATMADELTQLRERINDESCARIVIGGKLDGYVGKMPGVIEETLIAIKKSKPVFILGAFGGAAELLAKCINGCEAKELLGFADILNEINGRGYSCLNNGLSDDENKELFESDNVSLNIALILKGIKKLSSGEKSICKGV